MRRIIAVVILSIVAGMAIAGLGSCPDRPPEGNAPVFTYRVVARYPHDAEAFTQGLVFADGVLYESTGLYGRSSLRRVELETGAVLDSRALPRDLFGEGLTLFNGELIQLTWKAHKARIYNVDSFDLVREAVYAGEGWGLTHDGTRLILSDGTSTLRFFDPAAFNEIGSVEVHADDRPIENLNELEYIDGEIYANIWRTDRIARIDPETGRVLAWIDLAGLLEDAEGAQRADVLNGIAYDAISRRLFVTGKLWPALFEIELIKPEESLWHAGAQ